MMQLQSYNLDVVFKPGPEMHVSDVLSRATPPCWRSDTPYVQHAVCAIDSTQAEYAQLDQAQHLNVTALRFCQIVQHTATDDVLQELTSVILSGWPDFKEGTPLERGNIGPSQMSSMYTISIVKSDWMARTPGWPSSTGAICPQKTATPPNV